MGGCSHQRQVDEVALAEKARGAFVDKSISKSVADFSKVHSTDDYVGDDASGPAGVLLFHLETGHQLQAKDRNGLSDPYCIVKVAENPLWRSRTCRRTLDPNWDQLHAFEGFLRDFASEPLRIRVYDKDFLSRNECIGKCEVSLSGLRVGTGGALAFRQQPLDGVPSGALSFSVHFELRPVLSLFPGARA